MTVLEHIEPRKPEAEDPNYLVNSVRISPTENRNLIDLRSTIGLPAGFPEISMAGQCAAGDNPNANVEHKPGERLPAPVVTDLPGLPAPSHGRRQIIHLTPGRYLDIPYPEDYSVRNGITYGHVTIKVPGWVPGSHPYNYRQR